MGIISVFLAFFFVPLGAFILYSAHRDLGEMNAGRMDEAGRDLVRLARVLGIISTFIAAFMIFMFVVKFAGPSNLPATRIIEASR